MPTYVYECGSCGKTFETEQRITEDPLKDCKCGATGSLKRLIQPVAVAFKGAGFHINDYAPSAGKPADSAEGKKETESEKQADADKGKPRAESDKKSDAGSAATETPKVESKPAAEKSDASTT